MNEKINHTELILERMKHEAEMAKLQNENEKLKGLLKKAVEDIRKILASECAYECTFAFMKKMIIQCVQIQITVVVVGAVRIANGNTLTKL